MPTQGRRATLGTALRSALAQTLTDIEVVLVDDAPAGGVNCRERPEWTELLQDAKVRVVDFNQSRGCAAAKNAGLRAARGEWVCYLDDDNFYHSQKVEKQLALAEKGSALVLCGIEYRAAERRRIRQIDRTVFSGDGLLLEALPDTNLIFHRREGCPWWDEDLGTADDACFFQTMLKERQILAVPNVPEALAVYAVHDGPRANTDRRVLYRGNRRLLVKWSGGYSRRARRLLLLRILMADEKYRTGRWGRLAGLGAALLRCGGTGEWRLVLNAIGVKLSFTRRWMVR